ncbi:MAG: diguanylate cyclase [Desulfovibrio sp.]|uniref:diguanylate cyclase n=1 Tax=Desulfovibrio sp. 7SRBS1 TaxID=3378064 RepID=UPI003B3FFE02
MTVDFTPEPTHEILSHNIGDLLDLEWLQSVLKNFSTMTGLNVAFFSPPDNALIAQSGKWQMCCCFHEIRNDFSQTCPNCMADASSQHKGVTTILQPCPHGLMSGVTPVVIRGNHMADIHIGPFLYTPPDEKFFATLDPNNTLSQEKQDKISQIIPVVKKEIVESGLALLSNIASMIAEKVIDNLSITKCSLEYEKKASQHQEAQKELAATVAELKAIFNTSRVGVALVGKGRIVLRCNQRMADITGYDSPEEMTELPMRNIHLSQQNYEEFTRNHFDPLVEGAQIQVEYEIKRKDGTPVWCTFSGKAVDTEVPPNLDKGVIWVADDITEKRHTHQKLKDSLAQFEAVFENSQVGIILLKGGRFIERCNQRLADIAGYSSPEEMSGMSVLDLHISERAFEYFGRKYYDTLVERTNIHVECQVRRKDGSHAWCLLSGKALDTATPPDLDKGVLWMVDDITSRKQMEQRLRELASQDSLTGVLNRRAFYSQAEREWSLFRRHGHPLVIAILDLDHFKAVNDTYGHAAGDTVLQECVARVTNVLRQSDIIGRIGGEEFAIAMPNSSFPGGVQAAERIVKAFSETPIPITPTCSVRVTASIGITPCTPETSLEMLMEQADTALYQAKAAGRNRVVGRE